jgi:hypothetical protein
MWQSCLLVATVATLLLLAILLFITADDWWSSSSTRTIAATRIHIDDDDDLPYFCAPHPDLVTFVPGYGIPPSCWYSGYVHYEIAGQLVHTHYTLLTAEQRPSGGGTTAASMSRNDNLIYWSS